jgi:dienelactone hydrolase
MTKSWDAASGSGSPRWPTWRHATAAGTRQSPGWAAGYNLVSIPLAAGVLAWAGIALAHAVGAVLMSLSTIVVVRAGRDDPGLNRTIDEFMAAATAGQLAVELVDQPDGHHAFDVADDTDASRVVIGRVLAFLRGHLGT